MKREFVINRQGKDYVLYAGLLDEAHQQGLRAIKTQLVQVPTPQNGHLAICAAEVITEKGTFTGIGDAEPGNVNRLMANALIRMAETRAKARALRDAVNVGMVAIEELPDGSTESLSVEDELPAPPGIVSLSTARHAIRPVAGVAAAAVPADVAAAPRDVSTAAAYGTRQTTAMPADAAAAARASMPPAALTSRALDEPPGDPSGPEADAVPAQRLSGARVPAGQGAKPPATPLPPTQTQLETIAKLARSAGRSVSTEGLTRATASELITRLSEERYGARRGT